MKVSKDMREVYYVVNIDAHKVQKIKDPTPKTRTKHANTAATILMIAGIGLMLAAIIFAFMVIGNKILLAQEIKDHLVGQRESSSEWEIIHEEEHETMRYLNANFGMTAHEPMYGEALPPYFTNEIDGVDGYVRPTETIEPTPEPTEDIPEDAVYANENFTVCMALVEAGCPEEIQSMAWQVTQVEYPKLVNYSTFLAQLYHESRWDVNAVSSTNDYGIAQINECNLNALANRLGCSVNEVKFNPLWNMRAAMLVWSDNINNYSHTDLAGYLMRYNLGPGGASTYISNGQRTTYASDIIDSDIPYIESLLNAN